MTTFSISAAGHTVSVTADAAQEAALQVETARHNAALQDGEGSPRESHADYCATPAAYLQWVMSSWALNNASASVDEVRAVSASALASYAGENPPDVIVAQPGPPTPAALIAYAAEQRWKLEVGGITLNGLPIPTDDRAKLLLLGAAQSMADSATAPLVIGGVNYGMVSKAQFQAINAAVVAHVQSTFPRLAAAIAGITATPPTITDKAGVDACFS